MDLETLFTEADPARRVPLAGPDSAVGTSLYREIIARRPARPRRLAVRHGAVRHGADWHGADWHRQAWWRRPAMAGPVAAVLVGGLAGAVVLAGVPGTGRPGHPAATAMGQPPGLLLTAAVINPPPPGQSEAGMPPYYVTLERGSPVGQVRASATGKTLAMVPLPRWIDPKLSAIAASPDDRTFVVTLGSATQTRFYRLRIGSGGRSARLTSLAIPPLPAGTYVDGIAVSAGGSTLAVAIQRESESPATPSQYATHGAIEVISLATGAVRTWTTGLRGSPANVSWAKDGHELAFSWQDDGPGSGSVRTDNSGLWLLDTTAPGSNLLSGRKLLPASVGDDEIDSAVLTPDGNAVIASVSYIGTFRVGHGTVVGGIVELSARTGRPLRTLLAERAAHSPDAGWYIGSCDLVSADATSQHLLVNCNRFGRLDHGRFTALPGYGPQDSSPAAW
jgi:hypothetical protein